MTFLQVNSTFLLFFQMVAAFNESLTELSNFLDGQNGSLMMEV